MQEDGTAPPCPSLAGASDKLFTVLIVLAEEQRVETFVSVLAEQVLHSDCIVFVVQVYSTIQHRTGICDLFSCAS